jgi:hypothetical protein
MRILNDYQKVSDYAAANGIDLKQGYIVWVVDGDAVMQSGDGDRLVFSDLTSATAFAEKHNPKARVFVTGPTNSQFVEISTDRRRA